MSAASIQKWWGKARDFFAEHTPTNLPQLENDSVRLGRLLEREEEVVVCVLGQAAVGKSTLLNALVADADTVLPAGGIGPLTALATKVRVSEEPYFLVRYQDRKQLHGVRLAIEAELRRQKRIAIDLPTITATDDPFLADAESILLPLEIDSATTGGSDDSDMSEDPSASSAMKLERSEHKHAVEAARQ